MRRNRKKLRGLKYYNIIFSTVCGTMLISLLIIFFGLASTKGNFPSGVISVLISMSISAGGYLSGYLYGKQKRHKGITNGILCGAIIYIAVFAFGIIYLNSLPPIRLIRFLFLLCIAGAVGGIIGVNSKIKRPPL